MKKQINLITFQVRPPTAPKKKEKITLNLFSSADQHIVRLDRQIDKKNRQIDRQEDIQITLNLFSSADQHIVRLDRQIDRQIERDRERQREIDRKINRLPLTYSLQPINIQSGQIDRWIDREITRHSRRKYVLYPNKFASLLVYSLLLFLNFSLKS